jgi:hypothetical protein
MHVAATFLGACLIRIFNVFFAIPNGDSLDVLQHEVQTALTGFEFEYHLLLRHSGNVLLCSRSNSAGAESQAYPYAYGMS